MAYKTEQEEFWAGEFGNNYINRNKDQELIASNIALFSNIFKKVNNVNSIIEFGSNIGLNLRAVKNIKPYINCSAIEINKKATEILKETIPDTEIYNDSILDCKINKTYDFVLIKGVLIHINPDELETVYKKMYSSSNRYICIVEYYNPSPVQITYRGNSDRLFKRDFAGEIMDMYNDLNLIDYGFVYHRDNNFPQDDVTWFLMEKSGR